DELTHEFEARVAEERSGQQPSLTSNLKAVTDGEHRATAFGEGDDVLHHRAESRDGAGAQVVAVAEAAGKHDDVALAQIVILVPEEHGLFTQPFDDRLIGGVIAARARKRDDAEPPGARPPTASPARSVSAATLAIS